MAQKTLAALAVAVAATGGVLAPAESQADLAATFEITDGWMITPHIGRQTVKNLGEASYIDASLTVFKDFSGWVVSAAAVDARTGVYFSPPDKGNKDLGKRSLVLGVKYNF